MKEMVFNAAPVLGVGVALDSDPFAIDENTIKLGIILDYTKGAEDGIVVSFIWQDTPDAVWRVGGDSTAPGTNAWLPWTRAFTATTNAIIPIPENLLFSGLYRVRVLLTGVVGPTGTVTAFFKEGRVY